MIQPNKNLARIRPATRQDSINLKEDSQRVLNEYLAKGYTPTTKAFPKETLDATLARVKGKKGKTEIIKNNVRNSEDYDPNEFRTPIDEYQFRQRESASGVLNLDVKPPLYDSRVEPTNNVYLMGQDSGTYNDGVNIPSYSQMEISVPKVNTPIPTKMIQPKMTPKVAPVKTVTPMPVKTSRPSYMETLDPIADTVSEQTLGQVRMKNRAKLAIKDIKLPTYASGGQILQTAGGVASMIPGYGTLIGAGLNIAGGIMNANDAEKEQQRLEQERMRQVVAQQTQEDQLALQDYKIQGQDGVQYYAKGGTLPNSASKGSPVGGDLVPLDANTELVVGNKHEESIIDGQPGVTLMGEDGLPKANVEDEEVIKDGEYVFSDRLKSADGKTFANKIKNLTTRKVGIQKKAETSTTNRHTDGYNRMLEGIELQEQQLKDEQEFVKMLQPKEGGTVPMMAKGEFLPKYADGGGLRPSWLGSEATDIPPLDSYLKPVGYVDPLPTTTAKIQSPYTSTPTNSTQLEPEIDNRFIQNLAPQLIDNVGNAIINSRTPNLPAPILARARNLDSTVNVNPQLASVTDDVESTVRNIQSNTSNSNIARANMASIRLKGMQAKGNIYASKEAQERAIRNANTQNLQGISNANANTMNEVRNRDFVRNQEIGARTSANLANLSSDISRARETTDQQTNVDEVMLLSLMDDKTGAKMRAMERNPYFAKNPKLRNAIKVEVERRKLMNNTKS